MALSASRRRCRKDWAGFDWLVELPRKGHGKVDAVRDRRDRAGLLGHAVPSWTPKTFFSSTASARLATTRLRRLLLRHV